MTLTARKSKSYEKTKIDRKTCQEKKIRSDAPKGKWKKKKNEQTHHAHPIIKKKKKKKKLLDLLSVITNLIINLFRGRSWILLFYKPGSVLWRPPVIMGKMTGSTMPGVMTMLSARSGRLTSRRSRFTQQGQGSPQQGPHGRCWCGPYRRASPGRRRCCRPC